MQKTDVVAWAIDSRSFLDGVYNTGNKNKISDVYVDESSPIIETQILKAGIRLAGTLESIFKN